MKFGLGTLALHAYHRPIGRLRELILAGGPWEVRRTNRGRADMEAAATELPSMPGEASSLPFQVHLLTGARYWYQSAFCLWSLGRQTKRRLAPVLHDDGTLRESQRSHLLRLFPEATVLTPSDGLPVLDHHLPRHRYPTLRERWDNYPHLRKLIDPHLGSTGYKLVIDSDLLFFRPPAQLLAWQDAPDRPLHAVDRTTAYGYPMDVLSRLAGRPVQPRVNVGLCGLCSERLDWTFLEHACATLIKDHGPHYYLEQALVAVLMARETPEVLAEHDYVTLPSRRQAADRSAVMHHYVAGSKRWYFQENWRHVWVDGERTKR